MPVGYVEIALQALGGTSPYTWSLVSAPASLPPGVALRTDAPFPGYAPPSVVAELGGVATSPGYYTFTLQVTDSAAATVSRTFTFRIASFAITDQNPLPDAFEGVPFSYTMHASGGTPSWLVGTGPGSVLPPGLTMDSLGAITGTPTAFSSANYGFDVEATLSGVTIVHRCWINVNPVRITSTVLPNATQNVPYTTTLTADDGAGGPYTWTTGWTPPGLLLASNGVLSGTPTNPGNFSFWVTVTSPRGSYSRVISLCVVSAPLNLPSLNTWWPQTDRLTDAEVGAQYQNSFYVNGGTGPYTWGVSGQPPWLSIRSAISAQRRHFMGRTDHAIDSRFPRQQRQAADLVQHRAALADIL
jgi:hypothetical protein